GRAAKNNSFPAPLALAYAFGRRGTLDTQVEHTSPRPSSFLPALTNLGSQGLEESVRRCTHRARANRIATAAYFVCAGLAAIPRASGQTWNGNSLSTSNWTDTANWIGGV